MTKKSALRITDSETHVAINGTKRILGGLVFAAAILLGHNASAQEVDLGAANSFAILAGSTVTSTGSTVISGGNVGVYPGSAITGLLPTQVAAPYTIQYTTTAAKNAETALAAAYNTAVVLPSTSLTGLDLGTFGTTSPALTPGVYSFSSSAQLTGTLTLNGEGEADPVFIFQIGSSLTTATSSSVTMIDDGSSTPGISVFWLVGSSATLGTSTAFEGNILAQTSISLAGGATDLDGRLLAESGAVTLIDNTITAPAAEPQGTGGTGGTGGGTVPDNGSTLLLLGSALVALFAFERRFSSLS
jgi:hypothetical protein